MSYCNTVKKNLSNYKFNELLYAITNRRDGFSMNLPTPKWFNPKPQPAYWTMLQKGLMLDRVGTDYYPKLALTLLASHADILNYYSNSKLTFDINNPLLEKSKFTNGRFTSTGKTVGRFTNYKDIFPIPEEYHIKYKSQKQLIVTTDIGRKYISPYNKSVRGEDSILSVDWHERLPMSGPLIFYGDWNETSNINITYIPYGINYRAWIEYIEIKMDILEPLNKSGLLSAYRVSDCYTEKLSILVITLALLNTSINI